MTSSADRLPLGIRLIDAGMKRNPSFSVEHLDEARLARVQTTVIPDTGVGAVVAGVFLGRRVRGVAVSTTTYDAPHGAVPLRLYTPGGTGGGPRPVVVNFHGGGFTLGSARQGDWLCSLVARDAGAIVVSVDYRLAPTHRFPAAVDDCYGALRWAVEHAAELGGDPDRVGVMGDSAGGNLAAVTSIMARDDGLRLAHQALLYPATDMTDAVRSSASYAANTRGIVLSNADLEVFHGHYVPEGVEDTDWRLSPILAPDLSGLPPAVVVVAGLDPLHDSGVAYAAALNAAGGHASVEDFHLMPHGFLAFPYFAAGARPAVRAVVASMRGPSSAWGARSVNGDVLAVEVALGALTRGVRGRDVEGVVALFTEDGVLFGSGADEHAVGHDAIRVMMTGLFELPFTAGWTWEPPHTGRDEAMVWFLGAGELVIEVEGVEQRRTPYRLSGVLVEADEGYRFAMFNGSEPVG